MASTRPYQVPTNAVNGVHPIRPMACVADTDPVRRADLANTLRLMGYRTHETETGDVAEFVAHQVKLSVLIVNVVMPDMSGIDVIRSAHAIGNDTRILALVDEGRLPLLLELAHHAGAHMTLSPPFTPANVSAAVHEAWRDDPANEPWASPTIAHRAPHEASAP